MLCQLKGIKSWEKKTQQKKSDEAKNQMAQTLSTR